MKQNFLRIILLSIATLALGASARAEAVVAGHAGFAGQALDGEAIKAVLLGKKITVGDTRVTLIIVKASETQEKFLASTVGMTTGQLQNHWRRLFMTGNGAAPKLAETEEAACKLAAETTGAIVIAERATLSGLTVLGPK